MGYNVEDRRKIFNKAKPIKGKNPSTHRLDDFGNEIYFRSYGSNSEKGWEVDHIKPKSKGGSDKNRNLRPLNTFENRRKGDKYPY